MRKADSVTHALWFLRHGESTGNQEGLRQGQQDFPLSENGRRQVEALREHWRSDNPQFDAMITSPLKRATETAAILAEVVGCQPEENPRWVERDAGQAAGTPLPADPESRASPHRAAAHISPFPGAESRLALHLRASQAIASLLARPPGRYLIVAHGGIMAAAIRTLLGILPSADAVLPGISFDNTGYAIARLDGARGHWVLARLNDTCHLPR